MAKILLINPPQTFYKKSIRCVEQLPLGLLYIAAVLKKEDVEVEILDALREGDNLYQVGDNMQYGLAWSDITKRISIAQPDIVGISNPYSSQVINAMKVANIAKEVNPRIVTIMGGVHPTVAASDVMERQEHIDICVRGEGEYVMRDLVKAYCIKKDKHISDIPGLVYRDQEKIIATEEPQAIEHLDDLPLPAYEILAMEKYLSQDYQLRPDFPHTLRAIEMITSRGCPYSCVFCSVQCVMGSKFRTHSIEYVVRHIQYVIDTYHIEHIRFNDDNISLDRKRFEAILMGIIERNLKFGWDCPNGIRADTLMDESLVEKMKESGCRHIFIAAESGNQDVLNNIIGKKIKLSSIERVLQLCKKVGVAVGVYFILGLPGETIKTMHQTKRLAMKFLLKYNVLSEFFIATPLPGTRLLEICQKNGYVRKNFDTKDLAEITQGNAVIHTDEFSVEQVNAIYRAANRECSMLKKARLLFTDPLLFFKKVSQRLTKAESE